MRYLYVFSIVHMTSVHLTRRIMTSHARVWLGISYGCVLSRQGHHPSANRCRKENKHFSALGRAIAKKDRLWCLVHAMHLEDALVKRFVD